MEGAYRLRRQTSRWARFAEVAVHVAVAAEPGVRMDAGLVEEEGLREEAREGVWYALMRLPEEDRGVLVSVVDIVTAPADTGPGDVKFAAAHAVWRAVGREPGPGPRSRSGPGSGAGPGLDRWPWIGADGNPVFPE
ncbi:hypothetical protein ABTY61_24810 [Kitasatospora sp. NPDC096128]|uniref:hypothetical protein n=1 Tax=Kitasatospora sp. NPDC096128 TaxID=3155547 RepID=UPI0033328126